MEIRIDPPSWFSNMQDKTLQLMLLGENLKDKLIEVGIPHVSAKRIEGVSNRYAILELELADGLEPGQYFIQVDGVSIPYEIKSRREWQPVKDSISTEDAIYLLMPDRFARDKKSPKITKKIRRDPNSRHGGTIRGVAEHLNYIRDLGTTAMWLTPVLENDMPNEGDKGQYSFYHGYAVTDFYAIDSHFGNLSDYQHLVAFAHQNGLKIIMDFIFNHCGSNHSWVKDAPMSDWITYNSDGSYPLTNYKISTLLDPYAPGSDKKALIDGWFTPNMPNLNLNNPHLLLYMTQMVLWWIEVSDVDAIRMDTYPYVPMECMIEWQRRVQLEFPGLTVIAETWDNEAAFVSRIQDMVYEAVTDCSFVVMDFAFQQKCQQLLSGEDPYAIYNHFAIDFLYKYPQRVLAFLDNHDLPRWLYQNKNLKTLRQAFALLLTSPRIPQILYGTEVLLAGNGKGDGGFRQDFPGGWSDDNNNHFVSANRSMEQRSFFRFATKLLNWRKQNGHIVSGDMVHFIPIDGVMAYLRKSDRNEDALLVILNTTGKRTRISLEPVIKELKNVQSGKEIMSLHEYNLNDDILVSPHATYLIEIKHQSHEK